VARVCARLGWIPLKSETALEDLDQYPDDPEVHKYLHKRLMAFDLSTLYELHYLMITLGKVRQGMLGRKLSYGQNLNCQGGQAGGQG
jgi:hypothetical protein